MALQSLFPSVQKANTSGYTIPQGWSAVNNNANDVYRIYLGFGRKRETPMAGDIGDIFGDLEKNKLYNQQQDQAFAEKYKDQQIIRRMIGEGLYEYGLLGKDGNITNNWTHQFSTDNWLDKIVPALAMGTIGAVTAGALGFGPLAPATPGAGVGGLSGMDLAADAALGSGNNIATAGSMLGNAGTIAGTSIPQFSQLPGYGNEVATLANAGSSSPFTAPVTSGATNPALIESAVGTTGYGASSASGGSILGGLSSLLNNPIVNKVGGKVAGNIAGNLVSSVLGGGRKGISPLGNLSSLFTNYQQYNKMGNLIDEIKSIYKPDGEYAKYMENQLARRDAAAGRNSQYGPRLSELMARLGDSQSRALSGLGGFMATQQGGLNGMIGAGGRLAQDFGLDKWITKQLGGLIGSGGGMSMDDLWSRPPADADLDYWTDLWGD